jgi:hypothetical protein
MATLQDLLTVPPGWHIEATQTVVDLGSVDPTTQVEVETADFWTADVFGIHTAVPNIAQGLQQAAAAHGSNVYGVALLHQDAPDPVCDPFGLGICLPGDVVQVERYRWVIVHSQFQAVAILLGLLVIAGLVIVWICDNRPASQPCGDKVTGFASDTLKQMCNIFGAGCAVQALGQVILLGSLLSVAAAALVFALEFGAAEKLGLRPPRLPAVPAISSPQLPRISTTIGAPEIGPQVRLATGAGRGRRGMGAR